MTRKTGSKLLLCLSLLAYFSTCTCHDPSTVNDKQGGGIKGLFIFGSSLVDNGNNNFLQDSMAKADYLPYGIDFPLGPTGRFTNGKNVIDLLGDHLKLPSLIPAFADPSTKGSKIVHGVNYASGASGILDDTGLIAVRFTVFFFFFFFSLLFFSLVVACYSSYLAINDCLVDIKDQNISSIQLQGRKSRFLLYPVFPFYLDNKRFLLIQNILYRLVVYM